MATLSICPHSHKCSTKCVHRGGHLCNSGPGRPNRICPQSCVDFNRDVAKAKRELDVVLSVPANRFKFNLRKLKDCR